MIDVLLIDDEPLVCRAVQAVFEDRCRVAPSIPVGRTYARLHAPSVILAADLVPLEEIPVLLDLSSGSRVIVFTREAVSFQRYEQARKAGAVMVLDKVHLDEIEARVADVIANAPGRVDALH